KGRMLVQFTVGNFKYFKERHTLSLEATNDDWLESENVAAVGERRLLKSVAIYGPNASGKSNMLIAMEMFRGWCLASSKEVQAGERITVLSFRLHSDTESAPSFFEAIFLHEGARYRYGFEATSEKVVSEWLFSQKDSIRETQLFTRDQAEISVSAPFGEGKGIETRTRPNALFLSVVAQFNGQIATAILTWMDRFRPISRLEDADYLRYTANRLRSPDYAALIHELTRKADVGIERLETQELPAEVALKLM